MRIRTPLPAHHTLRLTIKMEEEKRKAYREGAERKEENSSRSRCSWRASELPEGRCIDGIDPERPTDYIYESYFQNALDMCGMKGNNTDPYDNLFRTARRRALKIGMPQGAKKKMIRKLCTLEWQLQCQSLVEKTNLRLRCGIYFNSWGGPCWKAAKQSGLLERD